MGNCDCFKRKKIRNEVITDNKLNKYDDNLILLNQVNPSIYKIKVKNQIGSGFFIKLYKNYKELFCLLTNEHVIKKEFIESNETVYISYNYEKQYKIIKLNPSERFIKYYKNMDVTIIEIIKNDGVEGKHFSAPNFDKLSKGQEIYIPQYPEGNLSYSFGHIKNIDNYDLTYNASTYFGSSGSPIFLKGTIKVIGIHKKGDEDEKENYGTLIGPIMDLLQNKNNNNYENIKEKGKSHNTKIETLYFGNIDKEEKITKIINNNGDYYIGPLNNGKMHGKGIIYFKNSDIKYKGDFVNDKKEGMGKYFFYQQEMFVIENEKIFYFIKGDYYYGQWKNDKMNGKGILVLKGDRIKYEGEFVNNKFEGYGKYYFESGKYYIGQWLNDMQHGKGKIYDKNGKVILEGDFKYDHLDGIAKIFLSDGNYYIGQYKEGKAHNEGKLYDKNGNVLYLCLFFNGKLIDKEKQFSKKYNNYMGQIMDYKTFSKRFKY